MTFEKADQPIIETTLRPGQTVSGKYCVDHLVAAGGMAAVWAGSNLITGKRVALKVILRSLAASPGAVELFRREALAASRVNHPNVVTIFDVVDHATKPCIVMELLDGEDLGAYLARRGRLPLEEAAALLLPVMRGVASANKQGVVHRDLKPKNIFLCIGSDGLVLTTKVLDFGISVFADRASQASQTVQLATHGTPAYMSPEHIMGSPNIDERADVYGFGVILFEALAGRPPYVGPAGPEFLMRILEEPVPTLTTFRPDLSHQVNTVVGRAIAKNPEDRYRNLDEFIVALENCVLPSSPRLRALTPIAGVPRIDSAIEVKELSPPVPVIQDAREPDLSGEHPGGVTQALLYVLSQSDAERALAPAAPDPVASAPVVPASLALGPVAPPAAEQELVEPAPVTLGPVPPLAGALTSIPASPAEPAPGPESPFSRTQTQTSYGGTRERSRARRPGKPGSAAKRGVPEGDTARVGTRRKNRPWRAVIIPSIVGAISAAAAWFVLPNPSHKQPPKPTLTVSTSQPVTATPPPQPTPVAAPSADSGVAPDSLPSATADTLPVAPPSVPVAQPTPKETAVRGSPSRQSRHEARKRAPGRASELESSPPLEPPALPPAPAPAEAPGTTSHRAGQLSTDDF